MTRWCIVLMHVVLNPVYRWVESRAGAGYHHQPLPSESHRLSPSKTFTICHVTGCIGFHTSSHCREQPGPPFLASCSSCVFALQLHLFSTGTPDNAESMCLPHPIHVGFQHLGQGIRWHMTRSYVNDLVNATLCTKVFFQYPIETGWNLFDNTRKQRAIMTLEGK